jgi:hypothetical protein
MKGTGSVVFITSKIEFGKYMYTLEFHLPFHAFRILSPPKSEVEIMFTQRWWSFGGQAFCKSSRADWVSVPYMIDLSSLAYECYLRHNPHLIVRDLIRNDATLGAVVQHETASLVPVCFQFLKLVWWQSCRTDFFLILTNHPPNTVSNAHYY